MRYLDATTDPSLMALSPALAEWLGEEAVRTGEAHFLLRRNSPYFLMGPGDGHLPRPQDAVAWAQGQGIPVFRRTGGGSLVLLDGGCLSFASAIPCRDMGRISHNFRELTAPVREALGDWGIPAEFGAAKGSYCEGPWDLVVGGLKVAGVAQALRHGFALVSGMLLVDQDPGRTTSMVNAFYEVAGGGRPFTPENVTSMALLTGQTIEPSALRSSIERRLGDSCGVSPTPTDLGRIEEFVRARRVGTGSHKVPQTQPRIG